MWVVDSDGLPLRLQRGTDGSIVLCGLGCVGQHFVWAALDHVDDDVRVEQVADHPKDARSHCA